MLGKGQREELELRNKIAIVTVESYLFWNVLAAKARKWSDERAGVQILYICKLSHDRLQTSTSKTYTFFTQANLVQDLRDTKRNSGMA